METFPFVLGTLDPTIGRGYRSPGIHISNVIRYLEEVTGKKDGNYDGWEDAALTGFLWEDVMGEALAVQYEREHGDLVAIGELEHSGLFLTPDRVGIRKGEDDVIWDFKVTWKSSRTSPPDQVWKWKVQLMCYCYATRCLEGRIAALYVCGDYQRPSKPKVVGTVFQFSQQELVDNWFMIMQGAKALAKQQQA